MMKSTSACWMREGAVASCTPSPAWLPKRLTEYADCLSAIVYGGVVVYEGECGRVGATTRKLKAVATASDGPSVHYVAFKLSLPHVRLVSSSSSHRLSLWDIRSSCVY
jgi:hypothetical protein